MIVYVLVGETLALVPERSGFQGRLESYQSAFAGEEEWNMSKLEVSVVVGFLIWDAGGALEKEKEKSSKSCRCRLGGGREVNWLEVYELDPQAVMHQ